MTRVCIGLQYCHDMISCLPTYILILKRDTVFLRRSVRLLALAKQKEALTGFHD